MTLSALDKAARYTFKTGDIVYTMNGGPSFYRVVSRTKCFVTLQRLQSEDVEYTDGGYGQAGRSVPLNIDETGPAFGKPIRTKIQHDEEGSEEALIGGNWYQHVRPYDGQPKSYDTY